MSWCQGSGIISIVVIPNNYMQLIEFYVRKYLEKKKKTSKRLKRPSYGHFPKKKKIILGNFPKISISWPNFKIEP